MLAISTFFFVGFLLILAVFKLLLADHDVKIAVIGKAAFAALILGKVVLLLRNRAFMQAFSGSPGIVRVYYRTAVYLVGVFVVLLAERTFHHYHEAGAIGPAMGKSALVMPAPAFAMKLAMGEMSHTVLDSVRCSAEKLLATGFVFAHPELERALQNLLGQ